MLDPAAFCRKGNTGVAALVCLIVSTSPIPLDILHVMVSFSNVYQAYGSDHSVRIAALVCF